MFIPLSLATLGPLPLADVSAGSGFYNLTRQMGGSIGIAILTTIVDHREAVHRSVLVEHVTALSPASLGRMNALAAGFARHSADAVGVRHQALAAIDQAINSQALLLSFADAFFYVAVAFVLSLPLLFFLGRGKTTGGAGAAAH
jgi:DHA2 family multidrug resistance protein